MNACLICGAENQTCGPHAEPGVVSGEVSLVEANALTVAEQLRVRPIRRGEGYRKRRPLSVKDKRRKSSPETKS